MPLKQLTRSWNENLKERCCDDSDNYYVAQPTSQFLPLERSWSLNDEDNSNADVAITDCNASFQLKPRITPCKMQKKSL